MITKRGEVITIALVDDHIYSEFIETDAGKVAYKDWLQSKRLGVAYAECPKQWLTHNSYIIVDERQFFLTKLRYGI